MKIGTWITILCLICIGCSSNCMTVIERINNEFINCIVDSVYRDPNNRGWKTIKVNTISGYKPKIGLDGYLLPELYSNAVKGDTIIKQSNTLTFKLIKTDTTMIFYPNCEGKEVKAMISSDESIHR